MVLVLILITAVMAGLTVLTLQMRILSFVEMKSTDVNFQRNQSMEATKSLTVRRLTHHPFVFKSLILLHPIGLS
jgi:hypothetical protein